MATHIREARITGLDAAVYPDQVANQITEAAAPSVGTQDCYVIVDAASDVGVYGRVRVPKNYVGTPVWVVSGILDGTPGAAETLGFGIRVRAVADNEVADGTFDAEEAASATIGSGGTNHADEDRYEETISSAITYAADDMVYFYLYLDTSGTTYTGNFLLTYIGFQFNDA